MYDVLVEDVEIVNTAAAKVIRNSFYMDDLLTGADTIKEAKMLQTAIHNAVAAAQFPLRKYVSNSDELLASIPSELIATEPYLQSSYLKSPYLCWACIETEPNLYW